MPLKISPSNNLSGNRSNPVLNAAGKDDKNHTKVFRLTDITSHPDIRLSRGGMILIGLMSGGDYQEGGLARCGTVTAHGLAKCGFGDSLFQAATTLNRAKLQVFLANWRHELCHELRTNSQGHIGRKQPALAKSISADFPDIDVLLSYTNPITSESMGRIETNAKSTWAKEPDLGKLAATCEFYFEWGYKEAIIKRFRTVLWHGAILRILRRAVLELDAKASSGALPPSTPDKTGKQGHLPVGTPSKMIAKHFSSMTLGTAKGTLSDPEDDENEPLIIKIHSERRHVSTDGILEYRLEVAPAQLVRIAESGIKGTRFPEGPDEWADEDAEEDTRKGTKKPPPDPQSHMRVWMPAAMIRIVEPTLVEDFEITKQRKQDKKAGKGRSTATRKAKAVAAEEEESADSESQSPVTKPPRKGESKSKTKTAAELQSSNPLPPIRDLTKKGASRSGDLKNHFAVAKLSNNIRTKDSEDPKHSWSNLQGRVSEDDAHRPTLPRSTVVRDLTKKRAKLPATTFTDSGTSSDKILPRHVPKAPSITASSSRNVADTVQTKESLPIPRPMPQRPLTPAPQYLSISDSESEDRPVAGKGSTGRLIALEIYDSDDPFDISPHPQTSLKSPPRPRDREQRAPSLASSSENHSSQLTKSPRRSSEHTSPRSRRAGRTPVDSLNPRPSSPSLPHTPLRPAGSKGTTRPQLGRPGTVESSDENDDVAGQVPKVPPLLLARARAKSKTTSASTMQPSLAKNTRPTKASGRTTASDFIDLT